MTKDFAAHNDKKSGAARLTRFTANALNNTLDTGAVGKLFTDADGNNKPGWRSTRRVGCSGPSETSLQTLHRMVSETSTNKLLLEE